MAKTASIRRGRRLLAVRIVEGDLHLEIRNWHQFDGDEPWRAIAWAAIQLNTNPKLRDMVNAARAEAIRSKEAP